MTEYADAPGRRAILAGGAALVTVTVVRPAWTTPEDMAEAVRAFTGGAPVREGRVSLDIPPLVENGNSTPVSVTVDSPMTAADHVRRIALFNERNPQPHVAVFHLGPRAGRAAVSTRMRLATSQRITAVAALSDGSFWSGTADVLVTLAACVEG